MHTTENLLDTYQPLLPPDTWTRIREFVVGNVRFRWAPGRTPEGVKLGLGTLTGFADWVLSTGVGELDSSVLLPGVIDAYAAFRLREVAGAVAERERKMLRTIAGISNTREERVTSTSASPSKPYTREEQGEIRRWTDWQATEARRLDCLAIATLGLGCGLTAAEMMEARARDIIFLEDGLLGVGTNGREIPVRVGWHDELARLAQEVEAGEHLIGRGVSTRNARGLYSLMVELGEFVPSARRMRATWLLAHMDYGTPVPNLLEAAGLESPDVLRRLLPFATRLGGAERAAALRLGTEAAR